MYKLETVEILGFWGSKTIETSFFENVNIFIGRNGTGKTTFINTLQAALSVDVQMLAVVDFTKIVFNLKGDKSSKKVTVEKIINDNPYISIKYKISTKVFEFFILPRDLDYTRRRAMHPKYIENIKLCKQEMNKILMLKWLSVHRELSADSGDQYYAPKKEQTEKPSVDIRLDVLMQQLTQYQLYLEYRSNQLSTNFQKNILRALLYNKEFDIFKFDKWQASEADKIKEGLIHAYKDLKVFDDDVEKQIENHTIRISESISNLKESTINKKGISVEDVLPLVLLNRTNYIIELSKKLEESRNDIFEQVSKYKIILEEYIKDKKLVFDKKSGQIKLIRSGKEIALSELSSGEKQILILLTEALLQNQATCVFIADEPELSLHIEWQQKLIKSITELNPNGQVIVATHSPEIAGMWGDFIIDMESVIKK